MIIPTGDGWVSVKEHMPMLDVPVMVFGERCKIGIGDYWGPEAGGWYSDYGEPIDVTHWRPLPMPPSITSDEEGVNHDK